MLVTGESSEPLSAVVFKVASSTAVPLASNATALSLSATRLSDEPAVGSCATTPMQLIKNTAPIRITLIAIRLLQLSLRNRGGFDSSAVTPGNQSKYDI